MNFVELYSLFSNLFSINEIYVEISINIETFIEIFGWLYVIFDIIIQNMIYSD
jgi:hypothetical protein